MSRSSSPKTKQRSRSKANQPLRKSSDRAATSRQERLRHSWHPFIIVVAAIVAFAPAIYLGWIWDDDQYVLVNENLRSWGGLADIWMRPSESPQYYPLVFTSFWVEYHLWGLNPAGYHLTNVSLHVLNSLLCYSIVRRLSLPAALWIALAFAIHPIQVESVAWITERKNLLSAFFYGCSWLTLWPVLVNTSEAGQREDRSRFRWRVACGCILFLSALLSKSVTATLPAAMLVAAWYHQRGRLSVRQVGLATPLLLFGALLGWNTARMERIHVGALGEEWSYGLFDRLGIMSQSIVHYVRQAVLPWEQIFFYPRFVPDGGSVASLVCFAVCVFVALVVIALAWRGIRGPFACLAFFVGSAFPALGMLNVYPHRFSFVADHFIYIPLAGLLCLVGSGVETATRHLRNRLPSQAKNVAYLPGLCLLAWYVAGTMLHLPAFTNSISLWQDTLAKNPNCPAALQNLGLEYLAIDELDLAEEVLNKAQQFEFDRYQTMNSLGLVYARRGEMNQAKAAFIESARLKNDVARPWINLGNALQAHYGDDLSDAEFAEVCGCYEQAWATQPQLKSAFALGVMHLRREQDEDAARWFESALQRDPDDLDSLFNLARCQANLGNYEAASTTCKRYLEIEPKDKEVIEMLEQIEASKVAKTSID